MVLKKRLILIAVSLFLILLSMSGLNAQDREEESLNLTILSKATPDIQVEFQEDVEVVKATMYGMYGDMIENNEEYLREFMESEDTKYIQSMRLVEIAVNAEATENVVHVIPVNPMFNGYYILELQVQDLAGNEATHYGYFDLFVTETDIAIIEPRLGVSDKTFDNLTIRTTRGGAPEETRCKIGVEDPGYNFESPSLVPFDPFEWGSRHSISNVFSRFNIGSAGHVYILCRDRSLNRVNQKRFPLQTDGNNPVIKSFTFIPKKVVEYPEFSDEIFVRLNVTANEPVICRYTQDKDASYEEMTNFDSFNEWDPDTYSKENIQRHELPSAEKAAYNFYVQCEDMAGWKSGRKPGTLEVDLSAGLGIEVLRPRRYTANDTISMILRTNKRSECSLKGEGLEEQTIMTASPDRKQHSYSLGTLEEGSYTYDIRCQSSAAGAIQEQAKSYTFTIDQSEPETPSINGTLVTCYNNKFSFEKPLQLSSEDPESGISHFLVQLKNSTGILINWTRTGSSLKEVEGDDIQLKNGSSYSFLVKAVNNVGLESTAEVASIDYDPGHDICLEKNPPIVKIEENKSKGVTKLKFTCRDESGCDNSSFYYGTAGSEENCTAGSTLQPPFTSEVRETSYVCYLAYDTIGNNATGGKLIEVEYADACNNLRKDGDETGVDCGGSCPPCEAGSKCRENSDCSSNYCENGTCATPTCNDSVINGPLNDVESDVDCGGHCSELGLRCSLNQSCFVNDDCESGFCTPDGACAISTCNDTYKGPEETGVDCGGVCAAEGKLCGIGSGCHNNSDCISGNCLAGTCESPVEMDEGIEFPISTILIILGVLMVAGGSGYLIYKRASSAGAVAAAPGAAGPARPEAQPSRRLSPAEQEKERARQAEQERRRKAMEEQRRKQAEERKKRGEEARKKLEMINRRKIEEREKLFKAFGEGKETEEKAKESGKAAARPEEEKEEKQEKAPGKEGWMSLSALKNKLSPAKKEEKAEGKEAGAPQEKAQAEEKKEETSLEKASEGDAEQRKAPAAPKPTSTFEELESLGRGGEKEESPPEQARPAEKEGEDVFSRLGEIPEKQDNVYDKLRDYIRPSSKSKKGNKGNK